MPTMHLTLLEVSSTIALRELFHDLTDWTLQAADSDWAIVLLALVAFSESIVFPIPTRSSGDRGGSGESRARRYGLRHWPRLLP